MLTLRMRSVKLGIWQIVSWIESINWASSSPKGSSGLMWIEVGCMPRLRLECMMVSQNCEIDGIVDRRTVLYNKDITRSRDSLSAKQREASVGVSSCRHSAMERIKSEGRDT